MSASSVNRRRILSLWLPRLPTDRLKRLSGHGGGPDDQNRLRRPWITVARLNNAMQIASLDDAAAALGLEPGLPLANARAISLELVVHDADPAADAELLNAIADWCDRFTPLVALDAPHGLLLDITGCAHLFGGEKALMQAACAGLARQGFIVSAGIASTAVCARALARVQHGRIVATGDEARAIAPLPVFALGGDEAVTRGLRRAGLKTIGDVAARAPQEITARFGADFTSLLRQALGQQDAPISPRKPLPDYVAEKRFAEPIASNDAIIPVLHALVATLAGAMETNGKGARRFEVGFFRTDGVVRLLAVNTAQPVTRPEAIIRLFRERLESLADPLDPGFGFDLVRMCASVTETMEEVQHDLDRNVHDSAEVSALIDRIAARLGGRRVVVHLTHGSHIPERAVIEAPAQHYLAEAMRAEWPARIAAEPPRRPLRLLERPEPLQVIAQVPDGPPVRFQWRRAMHVVVRAEGPERIAMEWWQHEAHCPTRDYFRVEDEAGLRFWLYRDGLYERETAQPHWYMHGMFA